MAPSNTAPKTSGSGNTAGRQSYKEKEKPRQIRDSNITAAKGTVAGPIALLSIAHVRINHTSLK